MEKNEAGHFKDCELITQPDRAIWICECHARIGQLLFGMNCTVDPYDKYVNPNYIPKESAPSGET